VSEKYTIEYVMYNHYFEIGLELYTYSRPTWIIYFDLYNIAHLCN
jgi:hypothetical protein